MPLPPPTTTTAQSRFRGDCEVVGATPVCCSTIEGERRRDLLKAMLQRVADAGLLFNADPQAVIRFDKSHRLLYTGDLPFGSFAH